MSIKDIKQQAHAEGPLTRAQSRWLIEQIRKDISHKDGKLHPSSISGCPTAAAYTILGFSLNTVSHDVTAQRIFDLGHAVHGMLQSQYHKAGLLKTHPDGSPMVEIPLEIVEWDLVGHADGMLDDSVYGEPAVLEIKTINSSAFTTLTGPKEEHKIQAACYVIALKHILGDSRLVVFVYYSKNDSKIKEFKHIVTDVEIQRVADRVTMIHKMVADFKERGTVPAPHHDNPNKVPCRYCPWQQACHDTLNRDTWVNNMKELHYAPPATPSTPKASKASKGGAAVPKRKLPARRK